MSHEKTPMDEFKEIDDIDKVISELMFQRLPSIVAEKISLYLENTKKFAYYEGRVVLLKKMRDEGIPTDGYNPSPLSLLNFDDMYREHINVGPSIETKYRVNADPSGANYKIKSFEEERDKFKLKLEESMTMFKFMLTPTSYDLITNFFNRTLADIRSNVGKTNDAIFRNYLSSFNLTKLLEYRWRSLLSDVSTRKKSITVSESFKEFIQTEFSMTTFKSSSSASTSSGASSSGASSLSITSTSDSSSRLPPLPAIFKPDGSSTPNDNKRKTNLANAQNSVDGQEDIKRKRNGC